MIRDLFTPFGLWLPRNSKEQAEAGRFINIRNLRRDHVKMVRQSHRLVKYGIRQLW